MSNRTMVDLVSLTCIEMGSDIYQKNLYASRQMFLEFMDKHVFFHKIEGTLRKLPNGYWIPCNNVKALYEYKDLVFIHQRSIYNTDEKATIKIGSLHCYKNLSKYETPGLSLFLPTEIVAPSRISLHHDLNINKWIEDGLPLPSNMSLENASLWFTEEVYNIEQNYRDKRKEIFDMFGWDPKRIPQENLVSLSKLAQKKPCFK